MLKVKLQFQFDGLEIVARGEFRPGDRVWLRAPSGFGKTSLLRVIAGVQDCVLSQDSQLVCDEVSLLSLPASKRQIGWVPQGESLFPGYSVREQLELPLKWAKLSRSQREAWIQNQITRFDLLALLETPVDLLSGGEKARVAMARACGPQVKVVLLDEPFSALDHLGREQIEKVLVNNFSGENAPVLVIASHDPPISQNFFTAVWQGSQKTNSPIREFSIVATP